MTKHATRRIFTYAPMQPGRKHIAMSEGLGFVAKGSTAVAAKRRMQEFLTALDEKRHMAEPTEDNRDEGDGE